MSSSILACVAKFPFHVDMEAMEALLKSIDDALDVDNLADGQEVQSSRHITCPRHQLHNWNRKSYFF